MTYFLHLIMRLQITGFQKDNNELPIINPPTMQAIRHLLYCANPFSGLDFDIIHLRDLITGNMEEAKKFCLTCSMGQPDGIRDIRCGIDEKLHDAFDTCEVWVTNVPAKVKIIKHWGEICLPDGSCI